MYIHTGELSSNQTEVMGFNDTYMQIMAPSLRNEL